ncbi:hypothetical protein C9J19_15405 [Photobacterium phosphoreum]|uniref:GHKL domain-containing protein n=1 Tax=Photobacterium phosphoreum TaxID=659 RepID=UPI000D17E3A9|nr:GHKL domain-containing protein [Photobacterium phosphoreum]PSW27578.1 hypothetical protein C9J19_15405 [Photobacterium phosphoreum]
MKRFKNKGLSLKNKIRKNFNIVNEINHIKKIDDINVFTTEIKKKLSNPIFQSSFYFNKSAFYHTLFNHNTCFDKSKFEHDWVLLTLKINKEIKLLNKFIALRNKYENALLSGEFEIALECINAVYDISGMSYWYLENKMSLLSYMGKGTELVDFYNQESSRKIRSVQGRELEIIFERAAKKVPSDRIDFTLDSLLEGLKEDKSEDFVLDYYMINFVHRFNCSDEIDYDNVLLFCWQCNIVDIYQFSIRILNIVNADVNSKYDVNKLFSDINIEIIDYKLNNIRKIIFKEYTIDEKDKCFIEICDNYIKGDFDNVIFLSEKALSKWPSMATIYEFYLNSLFNTNKEINKFGNGILYKILKAALKIISSRGGDDFKDIYKILYQFHSIDACQFICLLKEKLDVSKENRNVEKIYRFMDISSSPINPFSIKVDKSLCSETIDIDILESENKNLPDYRYKKRLADRYYEISDYEQAINVFSSIDDAPKSMLDEINNKKILSFVMMGDIENGVKELVELYFNNNLNTLRLNTKLILKQIDLFNGELPICIEMVIAIYILVKAADADLQIVSLYLDDYLDYIDVNSPSDINPKSKEETFLLNEICGLEVLEGLHLSRFLYKSTSDLMLDRVLMLSKVLSSDISKENRIKHEINFLGQQYAHNLCLKNIGKGKIYVNRDMLFKIISLDMSNLFDEIKNNLDLEKDIFQSENTMLSIKNNPNSQTFILSYQFLLQVRDLYTLDGRYGLDNSLNTDIRHNGIVPSIRTAFEVNNIICNKEFDKYIDNLEVKAIYKHLLIPHYYNKLQMNVKDFSMKIDRRLNKLKSVYMHINTNNKDDKDRLFKFIIDENDVAKFVALVMSSMTFEEIIEWSLNKMDQKTESSMIVGRAVIETGIKNALNEHIDELKNQVLNCSSKKKTNFIDNLSLLKNQLNIDLKEVSEWLSFAEKTGDNFHISTPIYEALSFVKKIFPTVNVNFDLINNSEYTYDGKYLNSFIKIFILLLENAVKSRINHEESNIKIHIKEEKEQINICVDNDAKDVDLNFIIKTNKEINKLDSTIIANREKGSGIYKVKKICEIDMAVKSYIKISAEVDSFSFNLDLYHNKLYVAE